MLSIGVRTVLTNRHKNLFVWRMTEAEAPANRRDLDYRFIHTKGSRKAWRWEWLSHTASAPAQTSGQPWWEAQSRHANSNSWSWPKDICSTRAGIGCERSAWLQWKCQEFVQRQQSARVPHLQRAVRLARGSPHHLTQLPPHTVPPLCGWHHEAGQEPRWADPVAPVGDQKVAGGVVQQRRSWGPHYQSWPWTRRSSPVTLPGAGGARTQTHGLRLMRLHPPPLLLLSVVVLPLHGCSSYSADTGG